MRRRRWPKLYALKMQRTINGMDLPRVKRPLGGWVYSLRMAHGLSGAVLADRLGVTRQAVAELEAREDRGTVSLNALAAAATALDATLVYYLRPNRPLPLPGVRGIGGGHAVPAPPGSPPASH